METSIIASEWELSLQLRISVRSSLMRSHRKLYWLSYCGNFWKWSCQKSPSPRSFRKHHDDFPFNIFLETDQTNISKMAATLQYAWQLTHIDSSYIFLFHQLGGILYQFLRTIPVANRIPFTDTKSYARLSISVSSVWCRLLRILLLHWNQWNQCITNILGLPGKFCPFLNWKKIIHFQYVN